MEPSTGIVALKAIHEEVLAKETGVGASRAARMAHVAWLDEVTVCTAAITTGCVAIVAGLCWAACAIAADDAVCQWHFKEAGIHIAHQRRVAFRSRAVGNLGAIGAAHMLKVIAGLWQEAAV